MITGLFSAYYPEDPRITAIDSNRAWTGKLPLLVQLFPDCRLICCVRQPAWIMDSVEKLLRKYPLQVSGLFKFDANMNVFDRADMLAASNGMIGYPLNSLKEAYYGPYADRLMLVDYDGLAANPARVISAIYEWLSLPALKHDFDNVQPIPGASEFDARLGTPGLHGKLPCRPNYLPGLLLPSGLSQMAGRKLS